MTVQAKAGPSLGNEGVLNLASASPLTFQETTDLLSNTHLLQDTHSLVLSAQTLSPRAAVALLDALPTLEALSLRDIGHWSVADWKLTPSVGSPWQGGHPATAEWPTIAAIGELLLDFPYLKEVSIHNYWGIGDLDHLGHLSAIASKLVSLEIPDSHKVAPRLRAASAHGLDWGALASTGTLQLTKFTALHTLDVSSMKTPLAAYSDHGPQLNSDSIRHIACLKGLQALNLAGNSALHPSCLEPLSSLTRLTSLDLTGVALGMSTLTALQPLQRMENLVLARTGASDAMVNTLATLSHLTSIDISGCPFGPAALLHLVECCPKLEVLILAGVPKISLQTIRRLYQLRPTLTLHRCAPPGKPQSTWAPLRTWLQLRGPCIYKASGINGSLGWFVLACFVAEVLHAGTPDIPRAYVYIIAAVVALAGLKRSQSRLH